jgi:hypothetical protein
MQPLDAAKLLDIRKHPNRFTARNQRVQQGISEVASEGAPCNLYIAATDDFAICGLGRVSQRGAQCPPT